MRWSRSSLLSAHAALLVAVVAPKVVRADFLTDWNNQELTQIRTTAMDPLFASRDLAILQVTMFDAINGVTRQDNSFYVNLDAPSGTSLGATMAAAGLQVMTSLYGSSSAFTALYDSQIASLADSPAAISQGIEWGTSVANIITSYRQTDGASNSNTGYTPTGAQGNWAPTPPGFDSQPLRPGWADVIPFRLNTGGQFRPNGPPTLDSAAYGADFNQVKSLGQNVSVTRTIDETNIANFWNDPQGTVTTSGHWNQALQSLTTSLSLNDKAKVFAAVNAAMADAAIATWDAKYAYNSWRPVTAIRDEAIRDTGVDFDNPFITGNAAWTPLFATPDSPEYVSLTSAQSQAAASVMATLMGGDIHDFSITADINGDGIQDITRNYTSFSQASAEAGNAGIYAGTQFNTSVQDGAMMGQIIAQVVTDSFTTPAPEPSGAVCILVAGILLIVKRPHRSGW